MDILIVGAGIAGLHCAMKLSQKYPRKTITVIDSYGVPGGRVSTYKKGKHQWEAGAGRIATSHPIISSYCDRYSLTRYPIPTHTSYINKNGLQQNVWDRLVTVIRTIVSKIPAESLGHYTVYAILRRYLKKEIVDDFVSYFPYRSELTTMRADLAFSKEFSPEETFYGIKEGLSAVVKGMVDELMDRGVNFLYDHKVTGVDSTKTFPMHITARTTLGLKTFTATKVIFAVHANALRKIHPFSRYPVLKHLTMTPLLRIYSVFPHTWFDDLPKLVTRNPLRYIIPINKETGVIMTSYTDADDTRVWNTYRKKGKEELNKALLHELKLLLPWKTIPKPTLTQSHYWEDGCTYWTPGSYDPVKESEAIMRPFTHLPDVYVCGESYSMKQAWMEGALEHADAMLTQYFHRF